MAVWRKAFSSENPIRAEIAKDVLENKGIKPIIVNKKEYVTQRGNCEVLVSPDELLRAIKIIEEEIGFE